MSNPKPTNISFTFEEPPGDVPYVKVTFFGSPSTTTAQAERRVFKADEIFIHRLSAGVFTVYCNGQVLLTNFTQADVATPTSADDADLYSQLLELFSKIGATAGLGGGPSLVEIEDRAAEFRRGVCSIAGVLLYTGAGYLSQAVGVNPTAKRGYLKFCDLAALAGPAGLVVGTTPVIYTIDLLANGGGEKDFGNLPIPFANGLVAYVSSGYTDADNTPFASSVLVQVAFKTTL